MKITIEGADPELAQKLVEIAARHGAELTLATVDTAWTAARAERYLNDLTAAARQFARAVVDGDGRADADMLRELLGGSLRGPAHTLSRAVTRGVRHGWWPEGTAAPITVVHDPEKPGSQRAVAYVMSRENVSVFRAAFAQIALAEGLARSMGLAAGGPGNTTTGRRIVIPDIAPGGPGKTTWTPDPAPFTSHPGTTPADLDGGARPANALADALEDAPANALANALEDVLANALEDDEDDVMECHVCLQPYEVDEEDNASHLDTRLDADHTPRS